MELYSCQTFGCVRKSLSKQLCLLVSPNTTKQTKQKRVTVLVFWKASERTESTAFRLITFVLRFRLSKGKLFEGPNRCCRRYRRRTRFLNLFFCTRKGFNMDCQTKGKSSSCLRCKNSLRVQDRQRRKGTRVLDLQHVVPPSVVSVCSQCEGPVHGLRLISF